MFFPLVIYLSCSRQVLGIIHVFGDSHAVYFFAPHDYSPQVKVMSENAIISYGYEKYQ